MYEDYFTHPVAECENEGPFMGEGHWDEVTLSMKKSPSRDDEWACDDTDC